MMRNQWPGAIAAMAGALLLAAVAGAQNNQNANNAPHSPWKYYPADRAVGDGGPAPKRDLTGTWAGESAGAAVPEGRGGAPPPMTDLGKELFARNKPIARFSPGGTNDPHARYCDPFGFPQNMTNEIRGMTVTTLPNRTFILLEYMDLWREIWTDGRSLPAQVGGRGPNAHDPHYNGYSVGRWVDDYTFAVDTTGLVPETWLSRAGYPHSVDAVVHERFHRDTHNDLTLTMTMDDPKMYTAQFFLGEQHFRWIPSQVLDEFTCIPSQVQQYLKELGDPAGNFEGNPQQGLGGARGGRN